MKARFGIPLKWASQMKQHIRRILINPNFLLEEEEETRGRSTALSHLEFDVLLRLL